MSNPHLHTAVCHRCGDECDRGTARKEGWIRTVEGWVCAAHPPVAAIDFVLAGTIAAEASEELATAVTKLISRDPDALANIDEAEALLVELRDAVAALRASRAA